MTKDPPRILPFPPKAPPTDEELKKHLAFSPAQQAFFKSLAFSPEQREFFKKIGAQAEPFARLAQEGQTRREARQAREIVEALRREVAEREAVLRREIDEREREIAGRKEALREAEAWAARKGGGPRLAYSASPVDPSPVDPSPVDPSPVDPSIGETLGEAVLRALRALHPQGGLDKIPMKTAIAEADTWLAAEAHKWGRPHRKILRDTVMRALKRRK